MFLHRSRLEEEAIWYQRRVKNEDMYKNSDCPKDLTITNRNGEDL